MEYDVPWAIPHRRAPAWVGDLIAAALVVGFAVVPFPAHEFRPDSPLVVVVALLPAALLPLRRRWPLSVLAACLGCYGIAAVLGTIGPGIVLAAAIAMFGVANRSPRRRTLITMAVAVPGIVLLSALAAIGDVFDPRTFQFAFVMAFAGAAGDATRSRREYIREMTERARRAEKAREAEAQRQITEERLRIARDLHDAVAHQISVISLNAGVASTSLETRPEKTREALASIRRASRAVLAEIGDLLEMLRADEGGEGEASVRPPQPGLEQLDHLITRFLETGLEVGVRREGDLAAVPAPLQRIAYRVVQEGLTNAHKHGALHRAHVLLEVSPEVLLVVVTNPVRDDASADSARRAGHGLTGLRERVGAVRGSVQAGSTPGGWRLAASLPLTQPREDGAR